MHGPQRARMTSGDPPEKEVLWWINEWMDAKCGRGQRIPGTKDLENDFLTEHSGAALSSQVGGWWRGPLICSSSSVWPPCYPCLLSTLLWVPFPQSCRWTGDVDFLSNPVTWDLFTNRVLQCLLALPFLLWQWLLHWHHLGLWWSEAVSRWVWRRLLPKLWVSCMVLSGRDLG